MTAGLGLSAYIDVPTYQRAPHGLTQQVNAMLGLNTTLQGTNNAAATSLQVASSTGFAVALAWILDGPVSEVVNVTGSVDGTHVTIAPGLQFAHNAGVSLSQAGTNGSLAEVILRASSWMEGYCQQGTLGGDRSLFAASRTERWVMPSMRAYIDRDNVVRVMPGHFPLQSVSALTIEFGQGQSLSLDQTQLELQTEGRLAEIPYLLSSAVSVGQQLFLETRGLSRSARQWAVLTYVGGFNVGAVPLDVQQAAEWVVSDFVSQQFNPYGAAEIALGKRTVIHRQRGDLVGDSILLLRAHDALDQYKAVSFA